MRYIARPNTWYDAGTVVELIDDYRPQWKCEFSLFRGLRNGRKDEEICCFDEFDIVEGE